MGGTLNVATHDAPPSRPRTVTAWKAVFDVLTKPQVTVRVTRIPAGTSTVTDRTSPSHSVSLVVPPANQPLRDVGVVGRTAVVVVTATTVVVVLDELVVAAGVGGDVVDVTGGAEVRCAEGGKAASSSAVDAADRVGGWCGRRAPCPCPTGTVTVTWVTL